MLPLKVDSPQLKRELGLWSAVAIVVGTVIGSGIFRVPQAMIGHVGSVSTVFLVWIVGGALSIAGALTYAEMAAALPEAGGEYVYLREAYGPFWGFVYGWTQMWVAKSGSIATLATAMADYLSTFSPALNDVWATLPLPIGPGGENLTIRFGQLLAMVVIAALGGINYFGVRLSGKLQVVITGLKIAVILALIAIGLGAGVGSGANFQTHASATGGVSGFFAALVAALWAYDGWNNVSMVSSEIRRPQRNLPLALISGTCIVMALYLLANIAYFYVLDAQQVKDSNRVAAEMMRHIWGEPGAKVVAAAVVISIFAALNGSILSGSRVPYAMARDGLFFSPVGKVHPIYHTPGVSILALSAWSAVLVLSGRYDELYTYVIFASWILYGMATAAVIVLRRKRPDLERPYRTVGYPVVPIIFVLSAIALIFSTLQKSPRESLMGLVLIVLGIPFYLRWKAKLSTAVEPAPVER